MRSVCAVLGFSLLTLHKVGEELHVDRIDAHLGYVEGNMQLLCGSLNIAKGAESKVPRRAINRVLRKLERVTEDRWSLRGRESIRA
jgi:hypothetical protein